VKDAQRNTAEAKEAEEGVGSAQLSIDRDALEIYEAATALADTLNALALRSALVASAGGDWSTGPGARLAMLVDLAAAQVRRIQQTILEQRVAEQSQTKNRG